MRRTIVLVLVLVFCSAFLFAAGSQEAEVEGEREVPGEAKPERVLKFSVNVAPEDPYGMGCQNFADLVYTKTNGKLKIDVYYGGVLGGSVDSVKSVMMGTTVDMTIIGGDALLLFYAPMQALAMPYTYNSLDHLNRVLASDTVKQMMADFEEATGVKIMGWHNRGPRQLTTTNRSVKKVADLRGLKMRVPPVKASVMLWETLGARPTTMDFTEVYTSLSQGVIDGQENPVSTIYGNKLHEVQNYLILTSHVMCGDSLLVNSKLYNKLPKEFQTAIDEAAAESHLYRKALAESVEDELIMKMKQEGVTVIEPDLDEFREATKDLYKKLGDELGEDFVKAYEAVKKEAKRLR